MTEREKVAARIRALLAKTVENGCTEDEAITAAAKAADMLQQYNLTLDEVEMRASPFTKHQEEHTDDAGARLWKPAVAIAKLTNTRMWTSPAGVYPVRITFFGFDHEVDVAKYLLEVCAGAMRRHQRHLRSYSALLRPAAARRKILPFLDGMADRLYQRILALVPPRPTGTGLVVLRGELITAALAEAGIKLQDQRMRASRDYEASYADGRRAADAVSLNKGLASQAGQRHLR